MIKSNGGIIGPDNVTTGGAFGTASGVFKLGEVTNLIKDSKWPTAGPQGFQVANSCRFNEASADSLHRATGETTGSTKWTLSTWIKRSTLGSFADGGTFMGTYASTSKRSQFAFLDNDKLYWNANNGAGTEGSATTAAVFRDVSAWYHVVLKIDTTQSSQSDRCKIYVNNVEQSLTFSGAMPAQNEANTGMYGSQYIGASFYNTGTDRHFGGYLAETVMIDNSALEPDQFGEFNSQTGIWVPKSVTGLTFGTNGFYCDYKDSSALGNDANGSNNLTVTNLTSIDQSTDTCSTNFATMNPLSNYYNSDAAFSDGNNTVECGGTASAAITSTIGASSGKWYAEFKNISGSGGGSVFGIESLSYQTGVTHYVGYNSYSWGYFQQDGKIKNNNSDIATYSSQTNGDICGIALDLDNNKLYFSKNGTWQNSADPSAGTGGISITAPASTDTGVYLFSGSDDNQYASRTFSSDFGSPVYAISSGNTDGNGFGNFEYAVPTGYLSLNTKNLAAVLA
jgi:hypothetical protein